MEVKSEDRIPTLSEIEKAHQTLQSSIVRTPILQWEGKRKDSLLSPETIVSFKAELFQRTGTFKLRPVLAKMSVLTDEEKKRGVIAGTGGNHGVAVSYAARHLGIDAKLVVPFTINPLRLERITSYGAQIVKTDMKNILSKMNELAPVEGRVVIHPFDHPLITLGTATLGLEFYQQAPDIEVLIIPIGGGGLASGVGCAFKQLNPKVKVYGVEPEAAPSMTLSFQEGKAVALPDGPRSIADSLSPPSALPYSYGLCRKFIDEIVLVSDDSLRQAMKLLAEEMKVFCEPACAASTAALIGPLREKCLGKRVGAILCGSNIDYQTWCERINALDQQKPPSTSSKL